MVTLCKWCCFQSLYPGRAGFPEHWWLNTMEKPVPVEHIFHQHILRQKWQGHEGTEWGGREQNMKKMGWGDWIGPVRGGKDWRQQSMQSYVSLLPVGIKMNFHQSYCWQRSRLTHCGFWGLSSGKETSSSYTINSPRIQQSCIFFRNLD